MENSIEKLIERARQEQAARVNDREQALSDRRNAALHRIANVSSGVPNDVLEARFVTVARSRVSEMEAYADMAEAWHDFRSLLRWYEVKDRSSILWKGYVFANRDQRIRIETGGIPLDLNIYKRCDLGYVCSLSGYMGLAVGLSDGPECSGLEAARNAYRAYMEWHTGVPVDLFPKELTA